MAGSASMGPPRERGGEVPCRVGERRSVTGFNGAAARTRRRGGFGAGAEARWLASMGPPRERGGEVVWRGACLNERGGFNGAAARTRRREPPDGPHRHPERRFNGAAARTRRRARPSGPRTRTRPSRFNGAAARTRRRAVRQLQRGRPHRIASMGPPRERGGESSGRGVPRGGRPASMGPPRERGGESALSSETSSGRHRFNGAAARTRRRGRGCALLARQDLVLQWGRRANAAESKDGKAALKARNPLQWGRRANAAESRTPAGPGRPGHPASMGPPRERGGEGASRLVPRVAGAPASMGPPRERGGEMPSAPGSCGRETLQWGRRANAAESACFVGIRADESLLQWGRRANAAESRA